MLYSDVTPKDFNVNPNWQKLILVLDNLQLYKNLEIHKAMRFYRPVLSTQLNMLQNKVADLSYPQPPADFPKEILDAMILNAENVMALKASTLGLPYWLWVMTLGDVNVDSSNFYPQADYIIPSDPTYGYLSYNRSNGSTGYAAHSTTSQAITAGTITLTTQSGLSWAAGNYIRVYHDDTHYVIGTVSFYAGTTIVIHPVRVVGTGTFSTWSLTDYFAPVSQPPALSSVNLFLFSDVTDFGTQVLNITISTKYAGLYSLAQYLGDNILDFIGFVESGNILVTINGYPESNPLSQVPVGGGYVIVITSGNATITVSLIPGIYKTYSEPYQYFVIP